MLKYAASSLLSTHLQRHGGLIRDAHRHVFDYEPREGFLYVRSRAISSRTNDNYDNFPADEIAKAYQTFIGKPVFVNHHNSDHKRLRGVIVDAALHEDMNPDGSPDTWAEVLMEIDAVKFPKLAQAILAGHIDRTSMGTDVEYSVCSYCGNRAVTPLDYCNHVAKLKGQRIRRKNASTGEQEDVLIYEKCHGLSFFENSLLVEDPADPTALVIGGVDTRGVPELAAMAKSASKTAIWNVPKNCYPSAFNTVPPPEPDEGPDPSWSGYRIEYRPHFHADGDWVIVSYDGEGGAAMLSGHPSERAAQGAIKKKLTSKTAAITYERSGDLIKALDGDQLMGELVWGKDPYSDALYVASVRSTVKRQGIAEGLLVWLHDSTSRDIIINGFASREGLRWAKAMGSKYPWARYEPTEWDREQFAEASKTSAYYQRDGKPVDRAYMEKLLIDEGIATQADIDWANGDHTGKALETLYGKARSVLYARWGRGELDMKATDPDEERPPSAKMQRDPEMFEYMRSIKDAKVAPEDVLHTIDSNGGVTVSTHDQTVPGFGFMVSEAGHERVLGSLTPEAIQDYIDANADALRGFQHYLGGWVDSGRIYLDVSDWYGDQDQAVQRGKAAHQLAVWDLAHNSEIRLDGKPNRQRAAMLDQHRLFIGVDPDDYDHHEIHAWMHSKIHKTSKLAGDLWDASPSREGTSTMSVDALLAVAEPWVRDGRLWAQEGAYLDNLMESMGRLGQLQPLVVRVDGNGKPISVLEGNHRLAIAVKLGWSSMPVITTTGYEAKIAAQQEWYHASRADLPVGAILTPGKGSTDPDFYKEVADSDEMMGFGNRADYVWLSPDLDDAKFWAADLTAPYIYKVEPLSAVKPWGITGSDGYVTTSAKVLEKVTDRGADIEGWATSKLAGLSLEAVISVAEQAMERGGNAGRRIEVPTGHVDSPEFRAAIAPLEALCSKVIGESMAHKVYASDYTLDSEGGAQAMVSATGSIVLRPTTNLMTLLHECAHVITRTHEGVGGHTPEFARVARDLYSRYISPEAGEQFWTLVGTYATAKLAFSGPIWRTKSTGYFHKSIACPHIKGDIVEPWPVSDLREEGLVAQMGSKACSTCFPSAPTKTARVAGRLADARHEHWPLARMAHKTIERYKHAFDESEHPRSNDGEFADKGTGTVHVHHYIHPEQYKALDPHKFWGVRGKDGYIKVNDLDVEEARKTLRSTPDGKALDQALHTFLGGSSASPHKVRQEIVNYVNGGKPISDLHAHQAAVLVDAIRSCRIKTPTLYRGAVVDGTPDEIVNRYKNGTIDLNVSSFSSDDYVAKMFADKRASENGKTQVIIQCDKSQALPVEAVAFEPDEHEWLTGGRFEVDDVATRMHRGTKQVVIKVHQKSPLGATPLPKEGAVEKQWDFDDDLGGTFAEDKQGDDMTIARFAALPDQIPAPPEIDTLREETCPICGQGADDGWNGDECAVCGYIAPPDSFTDPDLDKAKEVDLRQDQQDDQAKPDPYQTPDATPPPDASSGGGIEKYKVAVSG